MKEKSYIVSWFFMALLTLIIIVLLTDQAKANPPSNFTKKHLEYASLACFELSREMGMPMIFDIDSWECKVQERIVNNEEWREFW